MELIVLIMVGVSILTFATGAIYGNNSRDIEKLTNQNKRLMRHCDDYNFYIKELIKFLERIEDENEKDEIARYLLLDEYFASNHPKLREFLKEDRSK